MHDENDPFESAWVDGSTLAHLMSSGVDVHRYFNCLMCSKGRIDDDLRELLLRTAVSMVCFKRTKSRMKTDWCEGGLTTDFHYATLEGLSGIKFECKVDIGTTTVQATFIVGNPLLKRFRDARWIFEGEGDKSSLKTSYFN